MQSLITIAGDRGIGELFGEVLRENQPMLRMCRELGFTTAPDPLDAAVTLVAKTLSDVSGSR